ncbi:armadillo repeat-containing protein 2 isoform X2 [Emydura macquarii macquarii]|uniref:armadillo repeat-containing protein 2 isoform X2 n=1 Tax=Emydura macquarii macquarii TaxID=1129001 RepID=UPI00352AA418
MHSSKNKNGEKPEPFYRPSVPKQKTSAEIINEARNSLRTLRTQRPFTPRDDQRKLFGSASSRTPENRPPSTFSLHASSFESGDSRPVSGTRLSPLDHKPKLLSSPTKDEGSSISFPKPPMDSMEGRKVSSVRARLRRTASHGNLLPDKIYLLNENKEKVNSEDPPTMDDLSRRSNKSCLEELNPHSNFKDDGIPLIYNEHNKAEDEDFLKGADAASALQFRSGSDQTKKCGMVSSSPSSTDWNKSGSKAGSEDDSRVNETEEEENYWNVKILPIVYELENEDNIENLFLACNRLHQALEEGNMFGKRFKRRSVLLKTLYKLVDIGSDTLGLKLAKMILSLTATLRNLVDLPLSRCQLLCSSAVSELWVVLEQRMNDKDICTNIARIFSKLSSYNDCCAALADCSRCYILLLAVLNKHQKKQDLVVRVVFILGNLTAKNNQAREQFFKEKGSADILVSLFQTYSELDVNAKKWKHEGEEENKTKQKHPSEAEDVLIKLIRVLANLSIHPSVGAALAANHHIVTLLVTVLEYKSIDDCEELMINATATINNLSYYKVRNSVIQDKKLHIAELLLKLLMSSNMDGILEAVRVFGNLSQYLEIRDFIIQRKVYKFMIALLDAKHQDVCFSACGVLLNLTVDKNKRAILKEEGGIKKLVDCLRDFGPSDWQLACLVCKTLWNYSENITSAASCFEEDDTNTLLVLLASFLDEELALDYSFDRDLRDYHKLYWETEFKPVAQKLLNRIQSHRSFLQPVTITSF